MTTETERPSCPNCGEVEYWMGSLVEPGEEERWACTTCGHIAYHTVVDEPAVSENPLMTLSYPQEHQVLQMVWQAMEHAGHLTPATFRQFIEEARRT